MDSIVFNFSKILQEFLIEYPIIIMDDTKPVNLLNLFPYLYSGMSTTDTIYSLIKIINIFHDCNFSYAFTEKESYFGKGWLFLNINEVAILSNETRKNIVIEEIQLSCLSVIIKSNRSYLHIIHGLYLQLHEDESCSLINSPLTDKIGLSIVSQNIEVNIPINTRLERIFYYYRISIGNNNQEAVELVIKRVVSMLLLVKQVLLELPSELYYYIFQFF